MRPDPTLDAIFDAGDTILGFVAVLCRIGDRSPDFLHLVPVVWMNGGNRSFQVNWSTRRQTPDCLQAIIPLNISGAGLAVGPTETDKLGRHVQSRPGLARALFATLAPGNVASNFRRSNDLRKPGRHQDGDCSPRVPHVISRKSYRAETLASAGCSKACHSWYENWTMARTAATVGGVELSRSS